MKTVTLRLDDNTAQLLAFMRYVDRDPSDELCIIRLFRQAVDEDGRAAMAVELRGKLLGLGKKPPRLPGSPHCARGEDFCPECALCRKADEFLARLE